jgi:hypothetical protein
MKKICHIVAAPLIILSTLTSGEAATNAPPAQGASSSALYCWKSKLYAAGDDLVCNWADNATEACKGNPTSNISKAAIAAEPTDSRRCENGQRLVEVAKK